MQAVDTRQLEGKIREQFEKSYTQKVTHLHQLFKRSLLGLEKSIEGVFGRIQQDELLSTMLLDETTSIHKSERVRQIFGEVVTEEVEFMYKQMNGEVAKWKGAYEEIRLRYQQLEKSTQSHQQKEMTERKALEDNHNTARQELQRTLEEKQYMVKGQQEAEERFRDAQGEIRKMERQMKQLEQQNSQLKYLLKDQEKRVEEADMYHTKFRDSKDEAQELRQKLRAQEDMHARKYAHKKQQYKAKIEQYKSMIIRLSEEKKALEAQYDPKSQVEDRIALIMRENERRLTEQRNRHLRERAEQERKHEYKVLELNNYYQKVLEGKVEEIEANTGNYYNQMRKEAEALQQTIHRYENNYVPLERYQSELEERQTLMEQMQDKLVQFEQLHERQAQQNNQLAQQNRQQAELAGQFKQKIRELEQAHQEATVHASSTQQTNQLLKLNEEKIKTQFEEYQSAIRRQSEELNLHKKNEARLEQALQQNETALGEKQRQVSRLNEETQVTRKKLREALETGDEAERDKKQLSVTVGDLRKEVAEWEFKHQQYVQKSTLAQSNQESRVNMLQVQARDVKALLSDLQEKYTQVSGACQEEKSKNYELQNQIKEMEIGRRYQEQNSSMEKDEHLGLIEQFKKANAYKDKLNQELTEQLQQSNKQLAQLRELQKINSQQNRLKSRRVKEKLHEFAQSVTSRLNMLRKEGRAIKEYLNSRSMIMENDQAILKSTFTKEMIEMQLSQEQVKEKIIKRVKEQMERIQQEHINQIKEDLKYKAEQEHQKTESDKTILREAVKKNEQIIEEKGRQIKQLQSDLKRQREDQKGYARELEQLQAKAEKDRQLYSQKLDEQLREMTEDKESIIKEYERRKEETEREIQKLVGTLKRVKKQTEQMEIRHEEERVATNAQLRTIKEQEAEVAKISKHKDIDIERAHAEVKATTEAKINLEKEVATLTEHLNGRVQMIQEMQIHKHQMTADLNLLKSRCDRLTEEQAEAQRKYSQAKKQLEMTLDSKTKLENEMREIRGALGRSNKGLELRTFNELQAETVQLNRKVEEMKNMGAYLEGRTPLRS